MGSAIILMVAVGAGILAGYLLPAKAGVQRAGGVMQEITLYLLMLMMGIRLGSDANLFSYLGLVGFQSLVFAVASITGSALFVFFYDRALSKHHTSKNEIETSSDVEVSRYQPVKTMLFIFGCIAVGAVIPVIGKQSSVVKMLLGVSDVIVNALLILMVLVSGLMIGQQKSVLQDIRHTGLGLFIVPVLSLAGTLLASIPAGKLLGFRPLESMGISAACGWYTMSGVMLSKVSTSMGLIAFLCNLMREVLAVVFTPLIAKYFGAKTAIAPGGATTMDVTLPIILQSTGLDNAALCFSNGLILTIILPAVLRFFVTILL